MSALVSKADCQSPTCASAVLVCLSEIERKLFFPNESPVRLPGKLVHFNPSECSAEAWADMLKSVQPTVVVSSWHTPALPLDYVQDPELKLKYVCHLTGSVRHVVPRELLERGVMVTNWGRIAAISVAEHALLLILSLLRHAPRWRGCFMSPFEKQTEYRLTMPTRSLVEQHVGIHGFGAVAQNLVKLLQPFGATISAYSEGVPASFMQEYGVTPSKSLHDLFSNCGILVECEGLTPKSKDSVSAEILELLPEHALFVNVGRGGVVDEEALIRLAKAGKIRIALDVFREEPLPHQSPLLAIPDAVLSPHIGGPTYDRLPKCAAFAERNLQRFFNGEPLEAVISLQQFDWAT